LSLHSPGHPTQTLASSPTFIQTHPAVPPDPIHLIIPLRNPGHPNIPLCTLLQPCSTASAFISRSTEVSRMRFSPTEASHMQRSLFAIEKVPRSRRKARASRWQSVSAIPSARKHRFLLAAFCRGGFYRSTAYRKPDDADGDMSNMDRNAHFYDRAQPNAQTNNRTEMNMNLIH
jgi:hypothetical protein